jgi:hypothetical protein
MKTAAKILTLGLVWLGLFLACHANNNAQAQVNSPFPEGTLDLEAYWQFLEDTHSLVVESQGLPPNQQQEVFTPVAQRLEGLYYVRMPDGTRIMVDNSVLIAELRTEPPDPEKLQTYLETLLEQRQTWPKSGYGQEELQKLEAILSGPEYQWAEEAPPSPVEEWLGKQLERFMDWLSSIVGEGIAERTLQIGQWILIGLGGLVLMLILRFVWRGLRHSVTAESELKIDERIEENLNAGTALQKAQQMASSRDYRNAVRYLYLSALLQLEEHGLLRYDRSKTNREYLLSVMHTPGLFENLSEVVEVFDRVWYGYQPLDQTGYEHYSDQVTKMCSLHQLRSSQSLKE